MLENSQNELTKLETTYESISVQLREILNPEDQRWTYQITMPAFDGPMELLLLLIREHKLDIYDIPISKITQEYIAILDALQKFNMEVAGDFLVMAATLMQIKSRMILHQETEDANEETEDPRAELVRRLLEYKRFKEAAAQLWELEKNTRLLFPRQVPPELKVISKEEHLVEITLFGLLSAFKDVLIHAQENFTTELIRPEITVTQKINDLMDLLQKENKLAIMELMKSFPSKLEKIVTFLALLELVRLKLVRVYQTNVFEEFYLELILVSEASVEKSIEASHDALLN